MNQGEKRDVWGTDCFSISVVLTLLEHVISFSNFLIWYIPVCYLGMLKKKYIHALPWIRLIVTNEL